MSNIEKRLADIAAYLLSHGSGSVNYMKLLKLMYIADRESLRYHHSTISGDSYVSMNQGPVLSLAYDFIKGSVKGDIWSSLFETSWPEIRLKKIPGKPGFSKADSRILDQVLEEFGNWDEWKLVDFTHGFPEWEFPSGSSKPISLELVLKGAGFENEEAAAIAKDNEIASAMNRMFSVT